MTTPTESNSHPTAIQIWRGRAWRLLLLVAILAFLHFGTEIMLERFGSVLVPAVDAMGIWPLVGASVVFGLLLAIPFTPGMEMGLALMMMFGVRGVVLVYIATLLGFSLSFLLGRWVSIRRLGGVLGWLKAERAKAFVLNLADKTRDERLSIVLEVSPGHWLPFLVRHRYLALMMVVNLPGNALIGGGGGIALIAGMCGLFTYPRFLLAVAVAIAPLPFFFLFSST